MRQANRKKEEEEEEEEREETQYLSRGLGCSGLRFRRSLFRAMAEKKACARDWSCSVSASYTALWVISSVLVEGTGQTVKRQTVKGRQLKADRVKGRQ